MKAESDNKPSLKNSRIFTRSPKDYTTPLLRVTNVEFLNSAPFQALSTLEGVQYEECEPAECTRRLFENETDVGCIPVVDFLSHGGLHPLPFGIISTNKVSSVKLFSACPISELTHVFVDSGSHSSALLLRVLSTEPKVELNSNLQISRTERGFIEQRIQGTVGGLIIGDRALALQTSYPYSLDLAACWHTLTGLPFVFALWAARPARASQAERTTIENTLEMGVRESEMFARKWADSHGMSREAAVSYIENNIRYRIDTEAKSSIALFQKKASALGLLPKTSAYIGQSASTAKIQRVDSILALAAGGERISMDDARVLAEHASLADLGLAAHARLKTLHPEHSVSYIVDRNINYTNVCNVYCRFCAFYRAPGKKDGYTLSKEQLGEKIQETVDAGGIQILLQGGLNPELDIEYYEDLFRWIKANYPVNIHGLSADEVIHISSVSHLTVEQTLQRLIAAGLGSLPGAGAELLVDSVRWRIARLKTSSEIWLDVHRTAHRLGITSTATMMFGVEESWEDRLNHLQKIRHVQDETGGFTAFISWPFQPENTNLKASNTSAPEYLRVQAIARLFLDNIENIQSSWVTLGPSVGQAALFFGANDFGSVMFEENVVSAAGTTYCMNTDTIERHILDAGFRPWRRDVHYKEVEKNAQHMSTGGRIIFSRPNVRSGESLGFWPLTG